jgi:hypothetical protein
MEIQSAQAVLLDMVEPSVAAEPNIMVAEEEAAAKDYILIGRPELKTKLLMILVTESGSQGKVVWVSGLEQLEAGAPTEYKGL